MRWAREVMQPIAMLKIYPQIWPECQIIPLDDDHNDRLKSILDVAGNDKLIRYPDATISFLGQRFRRNCEHDDFTLRTELATGNKTELTKALIALQGSGILATYYAYGHASKTNTSFEKFRVLKYKVFLEAYLAGTIPEPDEIPNKDRKSSFKAWPFSIIPREFIFWELKKPVDPIRLDQFCQTSMQLREGI